MRTKNTRKPMAFLRPHRPHRLLIKNSQNRMFVPNKGASPHKPPQEEDALLAICEASSRRTKKWLRSLLSVNEEATFAVQRPNRPQGASNYLEALRQIRIPLIELSVYIEYLMSISPPSISPSAITTAQSTTLSTLPASQKNHCCQKARVMRI